MSLARWGWIVAGVLLGCGGAARAGAEAPEGPSAPEGAASDGDGPGEGGAGESSPGGVSPEAGPAEAEAKPPALPGECTLVGELCVPPREFVKKLCQDAYTGVALRLLGKGSPFSRGYVRSREVKAVNTLGGPSSDQPLRFEEEVLILSHTGAPGDGQLQVSGMGGYAVLRWDGTCATLGEEELGTRAPRSPGHADVPWKYIDSNLQAALLRDAGVEAARRQHRKHCHGVSLGRISAECARAEGALVDSLVAAVRAGIELPLPERMP